MDGVIESFVSITGCQIETALYFLEMSGYDLETSLQLFFEGGGAIGIGTEGGGGDISQGDNKLIKCLFSDKNLPESWLLQGLQFDYKPNNNNNNKWSGIGIKQHKNGPCGVLIAFQATVIANLMEQGRLTENTQPNDEDVIQAITDILLLCKGEQEQVSICTWSDPINGIGKDLETIEISINDGIDSVKMILYSVLQQFYSPGGVILLALSAISTVTPEKIRQFHTEFPLSFGQFHICSSALVQLLLNGQPDDNISAYSPTGEKRSLITKSKVGLLSGMEIEQKFLVRDELKFPTQEVYVLHGRDHFTLGFISNVNIDENSKQILEMIHWNGLPPGGPKITILNIKAKEGIRSIAPETAAEGVGVEYKPVVNTIDSIIQADPHDKSLRPKQWNTWTYEVALVIDDPTNQSPERPSNLPLPPTFSLKESDLENRNWRCRACYETRFQTMCFGMNEIGTTSCQYCGSNRSAVGWTLWLSYQELPSSWQRYLDRQHGPQIITILRTKWSGSDVTVVNENGENLTTLEYPSV